ncbi:hypothetical protein COK77_08095 [Bacillus cereus]|uniref:hypothetical protein n=1 Tax=Bacillus cereus TaxID=1396 RepID=UPI000BF376C9|nr:hypothetical protein [Bacillus cereus]PFU17507.1 hypothetical protein COK77_08095 [Bacillus cereus]PFU19511.1 hypothetical protein COK76_30830 [Bacillus cereus]PGP57642.1 hypothetical protein COA04_29545 [Bacillus cereus]HDR7992863.1 hypothetical protein [Bacillus cereus]
MSIEWDKVLPSVIGALTGGTMSLLGSYFSTRRQAKKEEERREYKEKRAEKIALKSVKHEIEQNSIRYYHFKQSMESSGLTIIDLKQKGIEFPIKTSKWEEHNDVIENIERVNLDYIGKLRGLYMNFYRDLSIKIISKEVVIQIDKQADDVLKKMKETLELHYK